MSSPHNLYLIGFMGCGKSAVAAALGRLYHKNIVEMDAEMIKIEGMSVNDIFSQKGEAYFRERETDLLKSLAKKDNLVVSCGGGVVLREENVRLMRGSGTVVWLDASPETILRRVRNNHTRPLLQGNKTVKDISALKQEREPAYRGAAHLHLMTDKRSVEEIARKIYESVDWTR